MYMYIHIKLKLDFLRQCYPIQNVRHTYNMHVEDKFMHVDKVYVHTCQAHSLLYELERNFKAVLSDMMMKFSQIFYL